MGSNVYAHPLRFPSLPSLHAEPGDLHRADDVFPDQVALEIDAIAGLRPSQIGVLHRERNDLDVQPIRAQPGDRQADAIDGNRSLQDDVRRQRIREADSQPVKVCFLSQFFDAADRVDVTLDEMSAETPVSAKRTLEVHDAVTLYRPERRRSEERRVGKE